MATKRKKHPNKQLALWHSRLGVLTGIFVVLLALTGILINHAHTLNLDAIYVRNSTLLSIYGIKLPQLKAVQVEQKWLVWQGKDLFLEGEQLLECKGQFVGAITLPNYWVAACTEDLFVFTYDQELVERVGRAAGIAYPINQIGACEALLCYQAEKTIYQMDIETLEIEKFSGSEGHALQWSSPSTPPENIARDIRKQFRGNTISWERVLLDLHAGRFLGAAGKYVLDAVAVIFIFLAISGIYIWGRRRN